MTAPQTWSLMQRVETCRYRAERIELAGADWSKPGRELAADLACQWRQLAEQMYALYDEREFEAVPPLRRNYTDLAFWTQGVRARVFSTFISVG
jgi:hypothetical protein